MNRCMVYTLVKPDIENPIASSAPRPGEGGTAVNIPSSSEPVPCGALPEDVVQVLVFTSFTMWTRRLESLVGREFAADCSRPDPVG